MVKWIGAILLIGGAAAYGLHARARLTRRVQTLRGLAAALDLMHAELSCMCTPTDELLERLCKATAPPLRAFFEDCRNAHRARPDLPIAMIWGRAVHDAEYLELLPQEAQTLREVGNALGRYDVEEELRVIAHARRAIEGFEKTAEETRARTGRLYASLSLMSGVAVAIMLL